MKKETKASCPKCGAKSATAKNEFTAVIAVVGKDSCFEIAPSAAVNQNPTNKPSKTAQERIEALRSAGVDVSNLFAIQGANGGDYIASNKNGMLSMLDDNDPIFNYIVDQGTVPNRRLFRRWVMAQMFHMMSYTQHHSKEPVGVTEMIHRLGYEYQWKMLQDELYAQMKMEREDSVNFSDRNRWFNAEVVVAMAQDYIEQLKKRVDALQVKKCKGIPYKNINSRDIFVSDLHAKLYRPLHVALENIKRAKTAAQLYDTTQKFNATRIKMACDTPQSKAWVDAYKGSGAFFTMQNLIRFHNCVAIDDAGKHLDRFQSLAFISVKAEMYKNGEGWRLLAVLKKMLNDNNIDIREKMAEWHKKKSK